MFIKKIKLSDNGCSRFVDKCVCVRSANCSKQGMQPIFWAVGLMRQMLAASQGDMVNDSTISSQSIETRRLFLRVCNTYDTRLTY